MVSEETKESIIGRYYLGDSKDDNATFNGVSTGTVFNTIKEHEALIGKNDLESIRTLAKFVKKNNISYDQISKGIRTNSILEKNNLSYENTEKLFSVISKLTKEKDLSGLIENAEILMKIKKTTGKSFSEVSSEYQIKTRELANLEALEISKKESNANLDAQYEKRLQRNNLTEKAISDYLQDKKNLARFGVSLDESPALAAKIMREIEVSGHNSRKLVEILRESGTLNEHQQKLELEISRLFENLNILKKQIKQKEKTLDFVKSDLSEYVDDINSVVEIKKLGYLTYELLSLGKILHKNGFKVNEFVKILECFSDISSFIDSLSLNREELEEQVKSLLVKVESLQRDNKSLEETKKELEGNVIPKFEIVNKELRKLKITNPLREMLCNTGDQVIVIPSVIIFLNEFKKWTKSRIKNSYSIEQKIDDVIKILEKGIPSVAA